MKKKVLSLALASTMIIGSASMSFAKPYDLINQEDSTKNYELTDLQKTPSILDYVGKNMEKYIIESEDGEFYNASEVSDKVNAGKSFNEAVSELEPVENVATDLKVESVSAITEKLYSGSNKQQKLEITVKDGDRVIKVTPEQLREQDYTIKFTTNKKVSVDENGVVTNLNNNGENFDYVVEVSKVGMDTVYSNEQTVQVVSATSAKQIVKAELGKKIVTKGDKNVDLLVSSWIQEDGELVEKETPVSIYDLQFSDWTVESSKLSVLNPSKANGNLMVTGAGETQISLKKKDSPTYSFKAEVKEEASVATTATATDVLLSDVQESKTVDITVKDQYGQELDIENADVTLEASKTGDNKIVDIDNKKVTLVNGTEAGSTDTILIKNKDNKTIGSFKVTVQKVGIEVTEELVILEGETTLDREEDAEDKELKLQLVGKDRNGVITSYKELKEGNIKSSDDDIAKVNIDNNNNKVAIVTISSKNEAKTGTATITVGTKTIDVKVIDSTPAKIKDNESDTVTVKVTEDKFNLPKVELTQGVKFVRGTLDGATIDPDKVYEISGLLGKDLVNNYVSNIDARTVAKEKLEYYGVKEGSKINVTVVNEAGIESNFTINFEKTAE